MEAEENYLAKSLMPCARTSRTKKRIIVKWSGPFYDDVENGPAPVALFRLIAFDSGSKYSLKMGNFYLGLIVTRPKSWL